MIYLNGQYMPIEEARIPVLDRGFIFGDGIYEFVPVFDRVPFRLAEHWQRLERSLREVQIANPFDAAGFRAALARPPGEAPDLILADVVLLAFGWMSMYFGRAPDVALAPGAPLALAEETRPFAGRARVAPQGNEKAQ